VRLQTLRNALLQQHRAAVTASASEHQVHMATVAPTTTAASTKAYDYVYATEAPLTTKAYPTVSATRAPARRHPPAAVALQASRTSGTPGAGAPR
jgi:hypothetical protein